jgi:hypothetical protein
LWLQNRRDFDGGFAGHIDGLGAEGAEDSDGDIDAGLVMDLRGPILVPGRGPRAAALSMTGLSKATRFQGDTTI